jgi:hypothetical protein
MLPKQADSSTEEFLCITASVQLFSGSAVRNLYGVLLSAEPEKGATVFIFALVVL